LEFFWVKKRSLEIIREKNQIAHLLHHASGRLDRLSGILKGSPELLDDQLEESLYIFYEADPKEEEVLVHLRPPIRESIEQVKVLNCK